MNLATRLSFLGVPSIERAGAPVQGFESRKALALLAYVVHQGAPVPRSQLAALFWPELSDERAGGNLRRALHNLASLLPGCLAVDRRTVGLSDPPACWIDTSALAELESQGTLGALAAAADLYRGPFLDGLVMDDCPELASWLSQARRHWHERVAHLLAELAARAGERQEWLAGLSWVDRLLALDPWREEAHRDKMRMLARSGQRDAALAQYTRCCQVLADELGLDPAPETVALYEQIRSGLPAAAPAPPRAHVPAPATQLLGRAEELAQIAALLNQPSSRLLTLLGPGGVGKTRLALEVLAQQQHAFDDGVCFVDLAPIRDPAQVASAITTALGVGDRGEQPTGAPLRSWLADRRMLLYLDNFEQVVAAAPLVSDLLAHSAGLRVLVSSRVPLRLQGEQEFPVSPLALPDVRQLLAHPGDRVAALASAPAAALFIERARSVWPAFTITDEAVPVIAAICSRLDGLPLAIELAATRVKLLSPAELLARLESRLPLLTSSLRDRPPHQQTLRSTIAWSYQLLTAEEQALFAGLSVFAGGWSIAMAEAVVAPEEDRLNLLDGMAALVDHSLVFRQLDETNEARFAMLETIHEYAAEQLAEHGRADVLRQRHADAFQRLADDPRQAMPEPAQGAWRRQIQAEYRNLEHALAWVRARGQVEGSLLIAAALAHFWRVRGYIAEGLAILEDLLGRADTVQVSERVQARGYYAAAVLANVQGDLARAQRWLEQAMEHYRESGDSYGMMRTHLMLGGVAYDQGDLPAAIAQWEQSRALAVTTKAPRTEALTLGNLGEAYYHLGDLDAAAQHLEAALALAVQHSWADIEAQQLGDLGNLARAQGQVERALDLQRRALRIHHQVGDDRQVAIVLEQLAATLLEQGDALLAARLLGAAAGLRRRLGTPPAGPEQRERERTLWRLQARLDASALAQALATGEALRIETLGAEALSIARTI